MRIEHLGDKMDWGRLSAMSNISVNLYAGSLDVNYDCSGAIKCKYALWAEMPIENDEYCAYRWYGSCRNSSVQIAAIENLKRRLSQHVNTLKIAMENEE